MPMMMPILMATCITFNHSLVTVFPQDSNISLCIAAVLYPEQETHDLKIIFKTLSQVQPHPPHHHGHLIMRESGSHCLSGFNHQD